MPTSQMYKLNYYALVLAILSSMTVEQSLRYFHIPAPPETNCKSKSELVVEDVRRLAEEGLCKSEIKERLNISREVLDCAIEKGGIYGIDWRKRGSEYQMRRRRENNASM